MTPHQKVPGARCNASDYRPLQKFGYTHKVIGLSGKGNKAKRRLLASGFVRSDRMGSTTIQKKCPDPVKAAGWLLFSQVRHLLH